MLDLAGVSMITWEWYVANYAPTRVLSRYRKLLVSSRELWLETGKEMAWMLKHIPDDDPKKRESKRGIAEAKKRLDDTVKASDELTSRRLRGGVVMVAVSLMLIGFVFQLIGAWPT